MNRLQFLRRLAALPLVAMAAPFVLSAATEAPQSGGYISAVSTFTSSGTGVLGPIGQEIEQLPAGQFAQPVGPAMSAANEIRLSIDTTEIERVLDEALQKFRAPDLTKQFTSDVWFRP